MRKWYRGKTRDERRAWVARRDREKVQARDRARGFRGNGNPDPVKVAANKAVGNAVRDGRLMKPDSCENCGGAGQRIEAHHPDYSKPLEVVWLCSVCHGREHQEAF